MNHDLFNNVGGPVKAKVKGLTNPTVARNLLGNVVIHSGLKTGVPDIDIVFHIKEFAVSNWG
jgi:hypothetical protein